MITAALITVLLSTVQLIGLLIPTLPATPDALYTMGDQLTAFVAGSLGLLGMIFTPALVIAVATVTIVRLNWTFIYAGVQFIWNKIPFLNTIKI